MQIIHACCLHLLRLHSAHCAVLILRGSIYPKWSSGRNATGSGGIMSELATGPAGKDIGFSFQVETKQSAGSLKFPGSPPLDCLQCFVAPSTVLRTQQSWEISLLPCVLAGKGGSSLVLNYNKRGVSFHICFQSLYSSVVSAWGLMPWMLFLATASSQVLPDPGKSSAAVPAPRRLSWTRVPPRVSMPE